MYSHISFCAPYEVCGVVKVSSVTTSGKGWAGSGPYTATELLNSKRGLLPATRKASSKARVLSKFERMPKSKSASHSPETAEAK